MKIVVDNQTNLKVEDQDGNVLFQWLPQNKKSDVTIKNIEVHHFSDFKDVADSIERELKKATTQPMFK